MATLKLSKSLIDAAKPAERDFTLWESVTPGFGLRVWPSGRKTFVLQYRTADGTSRRIKIGDFGALTLDQARTEAQRLRGDVQLGGDPVSSRTEKRRAMTVQELADRYMRDCEMRHVKPSSLDAYRWLLSKFILPNLGRKRLGSVSDEDVARLKDTLAATPYNANRSIGMIGSMFRFAVREKILPHGSDPTAGTKKFPERKGGRYLTADELRNLVRAIAASESDGSISPLAADALRLLMTTGCRLGEVLSLRWEQVRIDEGQLLLTRHKSDRFGPKSVPLSAPALVVLNKLARNRVGPFVFPGDGRSGHMINLQKPWRRIRKLAALDDMRIHDLRHSFASFAVRTGVSLPVIGGLLGHQSASSTARYAHIADQAKKEASRKVGALIESLLDIGDPVNQTGDPQASR